MWKKCVLVVCVIGAVLGGATPGEARFLEDWPYDKLMKEADLVVFAVAGKAEDTTDEPPQHDWPYEFAGQNTTFEVKHALKGKAAGKEIKVLHFKWGKLKKGINPNNLADLLIIDGPLLVTFVTKDTPEHLLFLKALKDGRYEPVSGRIDPRLAVRRLHAP